MSNTYNEYLENSANNFGEVDKVRFIDEIPYREACHGLIYRPTSSGLEVLLIRKNAKGNEKTKNFGRIGGRLKEKDATLDDCMLRETYEETNILGKIIYREDDNLNESDKNKNTYYIRAKHEKVIAHQYILLYESGIEHNNEPNNHAELKWFSVNNLPEDVYPNVKQDILTGIPIVKAYLHYAK